MLFQNPTLQLLIVTIIENYNCYEYAFVLYLLYYLVSYFVSPLVY